MRWWLKLAGMAAAGAGAIWAGSKLLEDVDDVQRELQSLLRQELSLQRRLNRRLGDIDAELRAALQHFLPLAEQRIVAATDINSLLRVLKADPPPSTERLTDTWHTIQIRGV